METTRRTCPHPFFISNRRYFKNRPHETHQRAPHTKFSRTAGAYHLVGDKIRTSIRQF